MSIKNIFQTLKRIFCGAGTQKKMSGKIKFFDRKKRFGFIIAGKDEYFFHAAATKPRDFKLLQDGASVTFTLRQGKKGPQADNIEIIR
jgi:CspA family cold shock protein